MIQFHKMITKQNQREQLPAVHHSLKLLPEPERVGAPSPSRLAQITLSLFHLHSRGGCAIYRAKTSITATSWEIEKLKKKNQSTYGREKTNTAVLLPTVIVFNSEAVSLKNDRRSGEPNLLGSEPMARCLWFRLKSRAHKVKSNHFTVLLMKNPTMACTVRSL